MVKYTYDAWGNHSIVVVDGATEEETTLRELIGNLNPIRYRSYYFDTDSGMYWLTTRFYDPKIGRFISQDEYSYLDPESINGLNLYAYCGNEPVMRVDPSGCEWYNPFTWNWKEIAKGVGLVVLGVAAIAAGIATLPYGGWVAAVAGVTILAGGGTVLFGLSDVGEGITNYNVIQEAVFMGNENAYNIAETMVATTAAIGTLICGVYGGTHTTISSQRSTPRMGKTAHSGHYNTKFRTYTYYGKNKEMKYSMHLFNKGHRWLHWHTELPHSKPINNFFKFLWQMIKKGF